MIFETHCHTRYGSACSYMSPEDLLRQAIKVGLDGVCITDHEIPWDKSAAQRLSDQFGILVIGGVEISTQYGDVLVWGLHEPIFILQDIFDLRRPVKKSGGFMVAAHPFRGGRSFVRWDPVKGLVVEMEKALSLPVWEVVDAMEVFNGMADGWEMDLCRTVCDRLPIMGTGGSDAHNVNSVGACVTVLENNVTTEEEFIQEMRAGRYRAHHRLINRFYPENGADNRWDHFGKET